VNRYFADSRLAPEGSYYDTEFKLVATLFQTDLENGLKSEHIHEREVKYGRNVLPSAPPKSPVIIFLSQFKDLMVIILLVVTAISLGLKDWVEALVLFLVVATNVIIGFMQEIKAEKALQALKLLSIQTANVKRNGEIEPVEAASLVPGDIVLLEEGSRIPADLRLFEAINLQIIESILTGESDPVNKQSDAIRKPGLTVGDRTNMAFMSTVVAKGRGKGIVVKTGASTEMGTISKALAKPNNKKTPLQMRLQKLGKVLVILSVVLCILVFLIAFLRLFFERKKRRKEIIFARH